MTKISFLDRDSFHTDITLRQVDFPHTWVDYPSTTPEQVIDHCADSDIIVTNKVVMNRQTLDACPSIKHIAVAATGYNIIDIEACQEKNISVSNIQNYAVHTVPEQTLAMCLALRRQLFAYKQDVIDGKWHSSSQFCYFGEAINDLNNTTIGIIGFGVLGQATAKLMHNMGMHVCFYSPSKKHSEFAKQVDLDSLLSTADIISLHCPLTKDTANLIDANALSKMQNHALLINLARGGIVDEEALADALINKQIAGAGIDVLIEEPPKEKSKALLALANQHNVIITPHIGWASMQAMQTLADQLIDNIEGFVKGKPQHIVIYY